MKGKIIKVTFEEHYYVDMYDEEKTKINGWSIGVVIQDWFMNKRYPMGSFHATRDGHLIGNSKQYVKHEIVDSEEV